MFFCAKYKDNEVEVSKRSLGIDYCVLNIMRFFISKVVNIKV